MICIIVFLGGFILNKLFNKLNTLKIIEGIDGDVGATIGKNLNEGEGHCTNDNDCGPGLKCYTQSNTNPPGVEGVVTRNSSTYGGGRYCYNPETKEFGGNLIVGQAACDAFAQNFPCIGKQMMTGPHSNNCLNDLWKKSGCTGDINDRLKKMKDQVKAKDWKDFWQRNAYTIDQDNMYGKAKWTRSADYYKANPANEICRGVKVDECADKYVGGTPGGRPIECLQKLWKNSGCTKEGKLNPDRMEDYSDEQGMKGIKKSTVEKIKKSWSANELTNFYKQAKERADKGKRHPKHDFDDAIYRNELCNGTQPEVPFEKPCWNDFTAQLTAHKRAELSDDRKRLKLKNMDWSGLRNQKSLNKMDGTVQNKKLASMQTQKTVLFNCKNNKLDERNGIQGKFPITGEFTEEACKEHCATDPTCTHLNYHGKAKECYLLYGVPIGMKNKTERLKIKTCKATRPLPHTNKWGQQWEINKEEYEKKYFPFWNFVFKSRKRKKSKPSWTDFKNGMLKIPGITNKSINGADSLVYEEFGVFGDLFRRLKFNYKKPFKSEWQFLGKEGASLGAVNGKVRFAHPAYGWPTWGAGGQYKERIFEGETATCTPSTFGGDPTPGKTKGCYVYNPGEGQERCSHPALIATGQCSDDIASGSYACSSSTHNIGSQPSACKTPAELNKRPTYVITQALFETNDFPYWQFERTMTRNQ